MSKAVILVAFACLGLAGCDRLGLGQGDPAAGNGSNEAAAGNEAQAGNASRAAINDAGITRSRSFAGLTGGSQSGKDPVAVPAAAQGAIDPGLLVGRWSDDGNCKATFEFLADGTFRTFEGGGGGWSLDGPTLTLTGPGESMQITLRSIDSQRLVSVNPDGTFGQSTRC